MHRPFFKGYRPRFWFKTDDQKKEDSECQKKRELYEELKEQYFSVTTRIEELEEREQKLKALLHRILRYTSKSQAYTKTAYIHFWTRSTMKFLYGEEEI